jgi:hypothetical protein
MFTSQQLGKNWIFKRLAPAVKSELKSKSKEMWRERKKRKIAMSSVCRCIFHPSMDAHVCATETKQIVAFVPSNAPRSRVFLKSGMENGTFQLLLSVFLSLFRSLSSVFGSYTLLKKQQ